MVLMSWPLTLVPLLESRSAHAQAALGGFLDDAVVAAGLALGEDDDVLECRPMVIGWSVTGTLRFPSAPLISIYGSALVENSLVGKCTDSRGRGP
jgi:hypothetical protein